VRAPVRGLRSLAGFAIAATSLACASLPDGTARVDSALSERTGADRAAAAGPAASAALGEDALVVAALRNNASFRGALADLGVAEAEWLRAGALPPATFSLLFPLGSKQLEYAAKLSLDVLWLRSKRVSAARRDWEATAEIVVQHGLDLVRDVRVACADAGAAFAVHDAWREEDAYRGYADYTERRFRAGSLAAQQVAQARLRAAAASDRRANDEAALATAAARLAELTQHDPQQTQCFSAASEAPPEALPGVEPLVADALAARPDLRAAELALEAAGARAGLARRELLQLIAVFDANGSGANSELGPGVELSFPLDGGRAARALADAKLAKASAVYQAAVQRVTREVREAHAHAKAAASVARKWREERLPALEAWTRRSEAAYRSGAADAGAVYEAAIAEQEGRREAALAQAAWRRARAELERAAGRRLELGAAALETPTTLVNP
jgi:cobalt-zinc-cadmium efflux system outer membrane protein